MNELTLGTLAVFGLLSLALGFGTKLGREVDELFDAWRRPAARIRRWWRNRRDRQRRP
ncbi:hypothetical protein ACIPJO_09620 [Streptomyces sp. NPDC086993]|uniref:hypothetical protein n=1 Tax=Streptomyces sp. NPDC086993 TaxID=3365765 RepID=UPI003812FE32